MRENAHPLANCCRTIVFMDIGINRKKRWVKLLNNMKSVWSNWKVQCYKSFNCLKISSTPHISVTLSKLFISEETCVSVLCKNILQVRLKEYFLLIRLKYSWKFCFKKFCIKPSNAVVHTTEISFSIRSTLMKSWWWS